VSSVPAQAATSAPLIERSIERATGIVYNITGGKDLTLQVGGVGKDPHLPARYGAPAASGCKATGAQHEQTWWFTTT
jgi:hypothetical protein